MLVGAVGSDFGEYEVWLKEHGVDTGAVHVSARRQTARFVCLTDQDANQIAAFYAGAMTEARDIDLGRLDPLPDLVVVAPDDPEAMLRHTARCQALGIPFAADPSQQLARLEGDQARTLLTGARLLFTNEYEATLLLERTGWSRDDVLGQVGAWITTLGADGVRIEAADRPALTVPAVAGVRTADPTGAGDAFRAGFLAALAWGLDNPHAARLGCALASLALAGVGSQTYTPAPARLTAVLAETYGTATAEAVAAHLGGAPCRP